MPLTPWIRRLLQNEVRRRKRNSRGSHHAKLRLYLSRLEDRRVLSVTGVLDAAGQLSIGVSGDDTGTLISDGSEIALTDDQDNPVDVTDSLGQLVDPLGVDDVKSIQVVGSDDGQSQAVTFAGNAFTLPDGLTVDSSMESATFEASIVGGTTAPITVNAPQVRLSVDLTTNGGDILVAGELTVTTFVELDPGSATTDLSSATGQFDRYNIGAAGHNVVLSPAGASPSTVYVDDGWDSLGFGEDPDGAGPARWYGIDSFSTIQEGIDAAGTVNVLDGTYSGNVDTSNASVTLAAGASPAQVVVDGNMTLDANDTLAVDLDGTASGSEYDQWVVNGDVTLGGAKLDVSLGVTPVPGDTFTIIDNAPGGAVDGQFNGLAEDATLLVDGEPLRTDYRVDAGGDVVLLYDIITVLNADDLGIGVDNTIEVRLDAGGNIEVDIDGSVVLDTPVAHLTALRVNGQTGDDNLTVDFSGGNPIPGGGLTFDGGLDGEDALMLEQGSNVATIHTISHIYTNAAFADHSGRIELDFDAGGVDSFIAYEGLEPITDNLDADNRIFTLPDVVATPNTDILLRDSAAAGQSEILGTTIENTVFDNPNKSLTVNMGNQGDSLTVQTMDAAFLAALTITGGTGTDTIILSNDLTLGSADSTGDVSFTAEAIHLNASIHATDGTSSGGGSIALHGPVQLGTDVTLAATGDVTFHGTIDGSTKFAEALTLTAGAGNIDFGGTVGGTTDLGAVLITSAVDVTANAAISANTFTQADGSGDTQFDGPVTLEGAGGLAVTTNMVTLNATIDTFAAGNGGPVTFLADGNVSMSADGDIFTDNADVRITAGNAPASGGSLTMSDGAVVNAGEGLIRLTADGDITVGGLTTTNTTNAAVRLVSISGAVVDGGDQDIDVVAPDGGLVIDAAAGVGDTSAAGAADAAIETTVASLHVSSGSSGSIAIDETDNVTVQRMFNATTSDGDASTGTVILTTGGSMTIDGDGVSAIDGDVTLDAGVSETSDLVVNAPVRSQIGEGGIRLVAGRDLVIENTSADPDVWVDGQSARIVGSAGMNVVVKEGAVIATGSGFIESIPTETGEIDPVVILVPVDQGGSNLDSLGRAIIEVTVTAPAGANFEIVIDWTDTTIRYTHPQGKPNETFVSDKTYRFRHTYTVPPDLTDPSKPIPVHVTVAFDGRDPESKFDPPADNGIAFFRNGGEFIDTTVSDELTVPGDGAFSFIIIVESEIEPVELRSASSDVLVTNQASSVSLQNERLEAETTELESAAQNPARLVLRRVASSGREGDDVELPITLLEEGMLDALSRLPNGRYRLYYQEPNSERVRMIREVNVHRGRVVPRDFREDVSERQPGGHQGPESADEAPLERIDQPGEDAMPRDESQAQPPAAVDPVDPASDTEAVEAHGTNMATGAAVGAMGGAALAGGQRWSEQVDRAYAAGRRSLTRAARLCRRLRRERSES